MIRLPFAACFRVKWRLAWATRWVTTGPVGSVTSIWIGPPLTGSRMPTMAAIDGERIEDLTDDILAALLSDDARPSRRTPPYWLKRAREAVIEGRLSSAAIARDAKVHRVHLSRAYKAHFGVTLSEDRRRARLGRAAREIIYDRSSLGAASISSGYADQAHLTRDMRAATGMTPKTLSRLF